MQHASSKLFGIGSRLVLPMGNHGKLSKKSRSISLVGRFDVKIRIKFIIFHYDISDSYHEMIWYGTYIILNPMDMHLISALQGSCGLAAVTFTVPGGPGPVARWGLEMVRNIERHLFLLGNHLQMVDL